MFNDYFKIRNTVVENTFSKTRLA